MNSTETHHDHFEVRQDPDTLHRRKIMAVTVGSVVITVVSIVIAWLLLESWSRDRPPVQATPPVAPRTISTIEQTLILDTKVGIDLRAEQAAALQRFGWADRDAGIATMPIEAAIEELAKRPPPVDRGVAPLAPATTAAAPGRPPARKETRR